MDALAQQLDEKLKSWNAETASMVRLCVAEVMELADADLLDLVPSRQCVQAVLDILDEPTPR
jgi:hypothetical protein